MRDTRLPRGFHRSWGEHAVSPAQASSASVSAMMSLRVCFALGAVPFVVPVAAADSCRNVYLAQRSRRARRLRDADAAHAVNHRQCRLARSNSTPPAIALRDDEVCFDEAWFDLYGALVHGGAAPGGVLTRW